ncbi:hypothetical protein N9V84_09285 [Verrucomicrobiales bacterium]|jgi:hypothetical protein|nr:hypothetical protein [Verrucomicrobiales bacterium]
MSTPGTRFPDAQRWFGFRPDSYSPDICPEYSLAGRVRGTWRRLGIQNAYDQGRIEALAPRSFEETLPIEEIEAMEKGDKPSQVSGERLPVLEADEVEIARVICWALGKVPVIAVYARPLAESSGYSLRLVSEFSTKIYDYPATIPGPLSLGELIDLFDHAHFGDVKDPGVLLRYLKAQTHLGDEHSCGIIWFTAIRCLKAGLQMARLPKGIQVVSAFYPNLGLSYRLAFTAWVQDYQEAVRARRSQDSSSERHGSN